MSISISKTLDDPIIDQEKAFQVANRKARRLGTELRRARHSGRWLFGLVFPFVVAGFGAGLGAVFGDDLAATSLGRAVRLGVQPVLEAVAGAGPVEFIVAGVAIGIMALVWYVRS